MLMLLALSGGMAQASEASMANELQGKGVVLLAREDAAEVAAPDNSLNKSPACGWFCSLLRDSKQHVMDTYTLGKPELYIPVNTYHMRYAYSKEKIRTYQEQPWGLGLGLGRWNEYGNRESMLFFVFQDSHFKPEYSLGYAWDGVWGKPQGFHGGLGYTIGITSRSDIYNYIPFPVLLPALTLGYHRLSLRSTFIPGAMGRGNVIFSYARWDF